MTDITIILELIISVLAMIVSIVLIPYIKNKYGVEKMQTALDWLEIAVNAAEEAARVGLIEKDNKYSYALEILETNGVTFDDKTMGALIDAKCYELFNQFKAEAEASKAE